MEIVAFSFLALGLIPFKKSSEDHSLPLVNKILFIFVAAIIFFSLGISTVSYDYTYCYVNQTTADYALNQSTNMATCASYSISNLGLSYLNMGMGSLSIVLLIVLVLFAALSYRLERNIGMD